MDKYLKFLSPFSKDRAAAGASLVSAGTNNYFTMTVGTGLQALSLSAGISQLRVTTPINTSMAGPAAVIAVANVGPTNLLANIQAEIQAQYRLQDVASSSIGCHSDVLNHTVRLQPVIRDTKNGTWVASGDAISVVNNASASTIRSYPHKLADGAAQLAIRGIAQMPVREYDLNSSHDTWKAALAQPTLVSTSDSLTGFKIVGFTSHLSLANVSDVTNARISGSSAVVYTSPGMIVSSTFGGAPQPVTVLSTAAYSPSQVVPW